MSHKTTKPPNPPPRLLVNPGASVATSTQYHNNPHHSTQSRIEHQRSQNSSEETDNPSILYIFSCERSQHMTSDNYCILSIDLC
ncbi:Adenylyl cyclase-associated protein [Dirofilaria immitis]